MSKQIGPEAHYQRLTKAVESRAKANGSPFVAVTNSYETFTALGWVDASGSFAGVSYEGLRGIPWRKDYRIPRWGVKLPQTDVSGSITVGSDNVTHIGEKYVSGLTTTEIEILGESEERLIYPHSNNRGSVHDSLQLANRITQIFEHGHSKPEAAGIDIYVAPEL